MCASQSFHEGDGVKPSATAGGSDAGWAGTFNRWLFGMFVAFVIQLIADYAYEHGEFLSLDDTTGDIYVALFEGQAWKARKPTPFLFIDIDDATHDAWGRPPLTPREYLGHLIEFARTGCAALIIVDIDLSSRRAAFVEHLSDGDPALDRLVRELDRLDEQFARGLAAEDSCKKEEGLPPAILLHREFDIGARSNRSESLPLRKSFIDEIQDLRPAFEGESPGLAWVATVFERSPDGIVRQWRLAQKGTVAADGNTREVTVPSVQLYACAFLRDREDLRKPTQGAPFRVRALSGARDEGAVSREDLARAEGSLHDDCGWDPKRAFHRDTRRFLYVIPWDAEKPALFAGPEIPWGEGTTSLFSRLPATSVLEAQEAGAETSAQRLVADKIVIIGGSYSDARDFYRTPVGVMPGAVVIANAIHSLMSYGLLSPLRGWQGWLFAAAIVLVYALLQHRFGPLVKLHSRTVLFMARAAVVLLAAVYTICIEVSGIWVNITAAIIAMEIEHKLKGGEIVLRLKGRILQRKAGAGREGTKA